MRKEIFGIPIFEDSVDLSKINISDEPTKPTWDSETPTTFSAKHEVTSETWEHLIEVITRNINTIECNYTNAKIFDIWRNVYKKTDYQEPHIHPHCQWSFIIYETVPVSKTVFFHPAMKEIQNHMGMSVSGFPCDYKPNLQKGDIIIFPSFLLHMALHGNDGSTIAGNVKLDYPTLHK
jgi:hypothetical protein